MKLAKYVVMSAGLALSINVTAATAQTEGIEEVVVTATQRPAALRDLAGNLAIITDVNFIGAEHPSEVLNRLPGVNIQHGSGQEHLTSIRSPVLTGGAGAGSFLYLEDGVPLRSPGFANVNGLFEAHTEQAGRIEVVRGPGSALYGSNAVHGLINVLTASPDDYDGGQYSFSMGSNAVAVGALALPFKGERASGLFQLTLKNDDGFRAHSGYDQQKATLRSQWSNSAGNFTFVAAFNNLNQETAGYIQVGADDFVAGQEIYKDQAIARSNPNPEAYRDARSIRSYLRWDKTLGPNTSLTITPYARKTDMDFFMHFFPAPALEVNGHKSLGILSRLYRELDGGHQIIVGIDVERTKGFLSEVQEAPDLFSFVTGTHYDYEIDATLISPYIHSEWALGNKTRITAGLRVDYTEYDYDTATPVDIIGRYQRISDRTDDFTTATPKLGITHVLTDDLTLFGLLARGQRAPQTTDLYRIQLNQVPGEAEPETIDSVELGLRDTVGPLQFELSTFFMRKENFFFRNSAGFNVSDGKTEHIGVELGFAVDVNETFDVSGSISYAEHTYAFDSAPEGILDGNDVDTAPKLQVNFRVGVEPRQGLRGELEWVHMDEYFLDGSNAHSYEGHDLLNLRLSYKVNDLVSLSGRIMNLVDTAYADRADFAFGSYRYFPGNERFFSLGIRVSL
jgi:outer membrane receptor protein involved in Fe transport